VLGLGREGIAQGKREIHQIRLTTRFYTYQSRIRLKQLLKKPGDLFTLGVAGWTIFKLLLLVGLFVLLSKQQEKAFHRLHSWIIARPSDPSVRVMLDRWVRFAIRVAPAGAFLVLVYLFFWIANGAAVPEVDFLRALVLAYGWYRLILSVVHRYITGSARSRKIAVTDTLSLDILRSVRLVLRYAFPVVVFLMLSRRVLGRGYLYQLVVEFAWLGAFPLIAILLYRWRPDIIRTFLNAHPDSRLANKIRESNPEKPKLILTAIAFVFVAARWLRRSVSDTLSRLKLTRKAFAYLFRRQLEKHAEGVAGDVVEPDKLPEALFDAFSEQPAGPELIIDQFPSMDHYQARIARWSTEGIGTVIALVGESGIGKTTWLDQAQHRNPDVQVIRAEIDISTISPEEVCILLGRILDLPGITDAEQFIRALKAGPKRLVMLDQCQNLIFRSVGGMKGFKVFGEIIGRTVPHIFWVCTFSQYAWEYAASVVLTRNIFHDVYTLGPWDEPAISAIINRRMKVAGFKPSFENLIVEKVDGTAFENEVIRTGERFRQLLWDYSDGIPRVAIHFWLRSLYQPKENIVKVRLFSAPSPDLLEEINEPTRFVLAALVLHQNLSIDEAAMVLNYPAHVCELILGFLENYGMAQHQGNRFYIQSHWHRAIVRYLKRKHLLYS